MAKAHPILMEPASKNLKFTKNVNMTDRQTKQLTDGQARTVEFNKTR